MSRDLPLTREERVAINNSSWFSALDACVRHDLLRCAEVQRYESGALISAVGSRSSYWYGCASGAVHIRTLMDSGRQLALTYVRAGVWFGDPGIFDGREGTHSAYAHGPTTVLAVPREDFENILRGNTLFCNAILRLQARHIRELYDQLIDVSTLSLGSRLAKQIVTLSRRHGIPVDRRSGAVRIGLSLVQEDLAQLIGSSRQRVNVELKQMERSGVIRWERTGLVVCNVDALVESAAA
jgi:CRP-like cAMP-binding protein